jgi:hypothetical protein
MPPSEERIGQVDQEWLFRGKFCLATDPAVGYAFEQGDPATRAQLIAVVLETNAAVYQALAQGALKAATIVAGKTAP